jgi:Asp-tRNA(Asn)/Glu-tRNA(Gln) amidotransferase A subunit family amidase
VTSDARLPSPTPLRSTFALTFALLLIVLSTPLGAAAQQPDSARVGPEAEEDTAAITVETLRHAQRVLGLRFTDAELEQMIEGEAPFADVDQLPGQAYRALREAGIPNSVPPALLFRPHPPAREPADRAPEFDPPADGVERPDDLEEVAYWPIRRLAALIRSGQVSAVELTRMYLDRLRRHDSTLHAVVTLTEERALEQARRLDRELAGGRYRGLLHGIPYGAKDLFAVEGHRTTWGAAPYRDQVIDETATVVSRLDSAGAVLVAKTTLGALAWGDVWYADTTRNPWNPEEGSSGSSAGSAAAVSAGLVPFALGTETLGSIVSPSTRTGVTGLRPSFGRVSRHGAMALSWSMDKVGPLCRRAEDCAVVFDALRGPDGHDATVVDRPFPYRPAVDLSGLRIGYLEAAFEPGEDADTASVRMDRETLDVLRELGAEPVPLELPDLPAGAMGFILSAEGAAAFDELTRSGRDSLMVRQEAAAWPNVFRSSRFIPAVEYLQANRLRTILGREMAGALAEVDVYVSPSFRGGNLLVTNLTGQPCVVIPNGFPEPDGPKSITFCARLYHEAEALMVAEAYQRATGWEERRPPAFDPAAED